jgi:hypothetical protein
VCAIEGVMVDVDVSGCVEGEEWHNTALRWGWIAHRLTTVGVSLETCAWTDCGSSTGRGHWLVAAAGTEGVREWR